MKKSWIFVCLASMAVLAGCATVPVSPPAQVWREVLPAESDIIIKARAAATAPLLAELMKIFGLTARDSGEILNRTREVYAGIRQGSGNLPDFSIILTGNFPKAASALFSPAKGFTKIDSPFTYWRHGLTGLQVALPNPRPGMAASGNRALFASQGRIEEMLAAYIGPASSAVGMGNELPVELQKEFDVSDLVFYMPYPGKSFLADSGTNLDKFPIRGLWVTLDSSPGAGDSMFVLSAVVTLDSEDRAKKFIPLLKLLLLGMMKKNGVDAMSSLKNDAAVTVEGGQVRLAGLMVKAEDLAKIFAATANQE